MRKLFKRQAQPVRPAWPVDPWRTAGPKPVTEPGWRYFTRVFDEVELGLGYWTGGDEPLVVVAVDRGHTVRLTADGGPSADWVVHQGPERGRVRAERWWRCPRTGRVHQMWAGEVDAFTRERIWQPA